MPIDCPYCRCRIDAVDVHAPEMVCPSCGNSWRPAPDEQQTQTEVHEIRRVGKFELLEPVGSGGYGAVWKARDSELGRIVAVKIPHVGRLDTERDVQRFLREARSSAQLRHPGIVPVHEVGYHGAIPYLVSDFIDGVRLTDLLQVRRLGFHETAELMVQVAEALDYAHSMGVVHRDIKPSNIMLEREASASDSRQLDDHTPRPTDSEAAARSSIQPDHGSRRVAVHDSSHRFRPLIMDFGLALHEGGDVTMTLDGQVLGTPAYMSPEQAAGSSHKVDRRSDVYSLGVVLYQLLTGELPFRGSSRMIREQVLYDEPRPPRRLNDKIPRDLETITLKCVAKEPARRYQTAGELAADLRRWAGGEPVLARPIGTLGRLWRWSKRKPLLASLNATVILLLLTVAVGSTTAWFRIAAARNQAEERLVRQYVANGARLMDNGELLMALPWFVEALRLESGDAEREAAHRTRLAAVLRHCPKLIQLWFHDTPVLYAEFSHDGRHVVTACQDGTVRVCDVHTGESITSSVRHNDAVTRASFSSDDRYILTASNDSTARVWDARTANPVGGPMEHSGPVKDAVFSPDSRYLATASGEVARVWNVATGQPVSAALEHRDAVNQVRFSPDGRQLLTPIGSALRGRIGEALVWDISTGELAMPPLKHGDDVFEASYSPDGRMIVTASYDRTVRLWDARTGEPAAPPLQHGDSVTHASFSPDGRRLVTVSQETAQVWDVATGTVVAQPEKKHTGPVVNASFGADGHCILSVGFDRTVRVWNAATGQPVTSPVPHGGQVHHASFSPEGRVLVTASSDGAVRVWDLAAGGMCTGSLNHHGPVSHGSFSPDGNRLATASEDCTARVWDPQTGRPVTALLNHRFAVRCVSFSPDGRYVVTAEDGVDGSRAIVWDAETGESVGRALEHHGAVTYAVFSPNGEAVLTASEDRNARIWNVASGDLVATFAHNDVVNHAAFSLDGRRVVTASRDRTACVWNADTATLATAPLLHEKTVNYAAFSPDGRRVVTASSDWSARIWDVHTGRVVAGPLMHSDSVIHARFSPDGRRVVTASRDRTAGVWDAASGEAVTPLMNLSYRVNQASFSPDGRCVLTSSGASGRGNLGEARLWDANTGEPITPILTHRGGVTWASFSRDGRRILTASGDDSARIWALPFDARPAEDLLLTAKVLSGYRVDATHGFVPAERAGFREAWQLLRSRYPAEFSCSTAERMAWHEREADQCAAQKQWFSAAWHFDRLVNMDAGRWRFWARRGDARAQQGDWPAAAADYAKAIELGADDEVVWVQHAVLRLHIGDMDGYRAACQRLSDRLAQWSNPVSAHRVVGACVLTPDAVTDRTHLMQLAAATATHRFGDDYHSALGAALYRTDQYEEALKHLSRAAEVQGAYAGRDWLLSAMAHHRLGQTQEAQQAFDKAVQRMDQELPNDPAIPWDGRLGLRLLRTEAETRLGR